jgi:hypothetical protein
MRLFYALALLLAAAGASAQDTVPDPTPPQAYYPLAVGNEWVYVENFATATREIVVGDSVVAGETYAVVERSVIGTYVVNVSRDTTRFLVRVDPAAAQVVYLDADGTPTTDGCPLDADFPATPGDKRPVSCGEGSATVSGGFDQFVPPGLLIGEGFRATTKTFRFSDASEVRYAAGVGRVSSYLPAENRLS